MTSKFFLPAKAVASILSFWLLLALQANFYGQTPAASTAPSPSPTPHKPVGRVRFWNMISTNAATLELVSTSAPTQVIATAASMELLANYNDLPPGHYTFQVFRSGDRQTPLKSLDVSLRDGTYATVLAHDTGSNTSLPSSNNSPTESPAPSPASVTVELVDDTPNPVSPEYQLTVRQYCPGARVIVSTASKQMTDTLDYGQAQTLTGLSSNIIPLVARASTKLGARTFNSEADFTLFSRTTLVIMNDAYGRFRPRLTMDGPPKPTPTPKAVP